MQDSPAAFGPASAVVGDFVPPAQGGPGDISSNSPGASRATSADSPSRSVDTPDRKRSSADDNRSGVGSGMRAGCKPVVADDNGWAEKIADSSGNDDSSSAAPKEDGRHSFSLGAPLKPGRESPKIQRVVGRVFTASSPMQLFRATIRRQRQRARSPCLGSGKGPRLCGVVPHTNHQISQPGTRNSLVGSDVALHNKTPCISPITHWRA